MRDRLPEISDVLALVGVTLIVTATWVMHPPAAIVVVGVLMLAGGLRLA